MSATEIILNICHRLVERRTAGAVPIYHLLSVVMYGAQNEAYKFR